MIAIALMKMSYDPKIFHREDFKAMSVFFAKSANSIRVFRCYCRYNCRASTLHPIRV